MTITQEKAGTIVTVLLDGRLDAGTSKTVEDMLLKLIDGGDTRIVLDLTALTYISSVGLRVLILAAKRVKPVNGTIVISGLRPAIQQVFDVAGFTKIFQIYPSRQDAARAIE